jgi:hypothetical protein
MNPYMLKEKLSNVASIVTLFLQGVEIGILEANQQSQTHNHDHA